MIHLITELSKYVMIILFAIYTWYSYVVLAVRNEERQKRMYKTQTTCMFLIHLDAFMVLFAVTKELKVLIFYGAQVLFVLFLFLIYRIVYKKAARLVINHMCMLMLIGFIILTRLNFDNAVRQFEIAVAAAVVSAFVPMLVRKLKFLRKFTWFYCAVGVVALGIVLVMGKMSGGAHLSFTVAGVTLQPSEFVKIIFVFFVAALLARSVQFVDVVKVSVAAAAHVLILVVQKDLGAALIFFITYVIVLYVASQNSLYLISALAAGTLAAVVAWRLFSHVQVRVLAWQDPWSTIDNEGYQVARSLFAIGTGGWFGMGLGEGMPNSIPVASSDFIFSAICEELGVIFAICLILVEISCFVLFVNIALKMKRRFYKLTALGLAVEYIFQVFLTIGGVTKFIPSTGVTLPLISYGGSSVMSTIILFCIIQGMYVLNFEEEDQDGSKEQYQKEQRGRNTSAKRKRLSQTQVR